MKHVLPGIALLGALSLTSSALADGSVGEQPIKLHCNISTRVIALQVDIGLDPVNGYLAFEVDQFHASNSAQTFKLKGSNGSFFSKTVSIKDDYFFKSIEATGDISQRRISDFSNLSLKLKKLAEGIYDFELVSFKIDGKELGALALGVNPLCHTNH